MFSLLLTSLNGGKYNKAFLPEWSKAAQHVLLLQPSSAAAERVFSLLNASFGNSQENTLEDYLEASLMLQYNKPMISCLHLFTAEYFVHSNFFLLLANFCEHNRHFCEHNKGRCWALEHSIIGKKKSIICMCLQ